MVLSTIVRPLDGGASGSKQGRYAANWKGLQRPLTGRQRVASLAPAGRLSRRLRDQQIRVLLTTAIAKLEGR